MNSMIRMVVIFLALAAMVQTVVFAVNESDRKILVQGPNGGEPGV